VEKATLDLSYTRITSPIDGLVGATQVKPGNLVGRGESTLLTTISQIDPILFRVAVTEADYLRYSKRQATRADTASSSGIQLTLADGSTYAHTGRVNLVDRAVDPTTGTLGLQLEYPNPELLLRPGQYGRARLLLETNTGRAAGSAASRPGTAEHLQRGAGGRGQQGGISHREGRPAGWLAVGD
jgi:membrane fusion protein (multidrug efflux system)